MHIMTAVLHIISCVCFPTPALSGKSNKASPLITVMDYTRPRQNSDMIQVKTMQNQYKSNAKKIETWPGVEQNHKVQVITLVHCPIEITEMNMEW